MCPNRVTFTNKHLNAQHALALYFLARGMSNELEFLFLLALPVAVIAWTVTHEEIFAEPRAYCQRCSQTRKWLLARKFFYIFTCEYCFSFYVTALILFITRFQLLYTDWRGYLVSFFSLIWIANLYMSLFFRLRLGIKKEGVEAKIEEKEFTRMEQGSSQKTKVPYTGNTEL